MKKLACIIKSDSVCIKTYTQIAVHMFELNIGTNITTMQTYIYNDAQVVTYTDM